MKLGSPEALFHPRNSLPFGTGEVQRECNRCCSNRSTPFVEVDHQSTGDERDKQKSRFGYGTQVMLGQDKVTAFRSRDCSFNNNMSKRSIQKSLPKKSPITIIEFECNAHHQR